MSPIVDDLRNDIRLAVDRYEGVESTGFTKESLAAICECLGADIDPGNLPPTAEMRATIRQRAGIDEAASAPDRSFRKAELAAIATALDRD